MNRIAAELNRIRLKPSQKFRVQAQDSNIHSWTVIIVGEKGTLYEDHELKMQLTFGKEYPYKAPDMKFTVPMFHPNISQKGEVCNNLLNSDWTPTTSIKFLIENIVNMLSSPNVDDPLDPDAANLYKSDRDAYNRRVRNTLN